VRPQVPPDVEHAVASLGLPDRFSAALAAYAAKLIDGLAPQCIILYGSLARGTYTTASDIDLVVVAGNLPDKFFDRLDVLQRLNDTRCPIDAFSYTPEEFQSMLQRGHVTALDALADGAPLFGADYFGRLRELFQNMVQRGLHRSTCSWVLPRPA
jgi:predicted nucleotidyltransferase